MIGPLVEQPGRFEFFQAARLIERHLLGNGSGRQAVGTDADPGDETIRFHVLPSLVYPGRTVAEVVPPPTAEESRAPARVQVTFMGLTGPHGVLPEHYTALLLTRLRHRDTALRDFFDLFHHRVISHFYRAWEKYRPLFRFERGRLEGNRDELFSHVLFSLIGLGTDGLRGRMEFADELIAFYTGQFSRRVRSAGELERMLAEQFQVPVEIEQFAGQWLRLESSDRSRLGESGSAPGQYNALGADVVLGERVWDVQGRFRIRLGTLDRSQFRRFLPSGDLLKPLCRFARACVGPEFDFDVQVVLARGAVPPCLLGLEDADAPRLGWNTWLVSRTPREDLADAVFSLSAA